MPAKKCSHSGGDRALLVIAVFKLVKGAALLALALGALRFFYKDVAAHVAHWLDQLRIDPDNQFIGTILSKLEMVHTKELKELSALGTGYPALFLTEGNDLLFRKRWAEWLTTVATSSLMPLEMYELIKEFTAVRLLAIEQSAPIRSREQAFGGAPLFDFYRAYQSIPSYEPHLRTSTMTTKQKKSNEKRNR